MAERSDEPGSWKRAAARRAVVPAVLLVAGVVCVVLGGDLVMVGGALIAVAGVLGMSLVFLEVGYSEERERARRAPRAPGPPLHREPASPLRSRPRRRRP